MADIVFAKKRYGEWKRFWESEMGKIALAKMEQLKNGQLDVAMDLSTNAQVPNDSAILAAVNRARGIELVIGDIKHGIELAKLNSKKELED